MPLTTLSSYRLTQKARFLQDIVLPQQASQSLKTSGVFTVLSGKIQAQGVVQLYLVAKDWKEQKSNQIEVLAHLHYFQVNNKIMIKTFQPEKFNLQLSETDFKAEFFKQISTSQLMLS